MALIYSFGNCGPGIFHVPLGGTFTDLQFLGNFSVIISFDSIKRYDFSLCFGQFLHRQVYVIEVDFRLMIIGSSAVVIYIFLLDFKVFSLSFKMPEVV